MDLPFERRVLYYLANGLLGSMNVFPPIIILVPSLFGPISFQKIIQLIPSGVSGTFQNSFFKDPEMRSTWTRIFYNVSIFVALLATSIFYPIFYPSEENSYEFFSDGLNGLDTWILIVAWGSSIVVSTREFRRTCNFGYLFDRAQERFPNVERGRLLKLAGQAIRSDDPDDFIENYEFPAIGA